MPSGKQKKKTSKGAGKRASPAKRMTLDERFSQSAPYTSEPISQSRTVVVKDPVVRPSTRGVTVRHREYVADVSIPSGATAFQAVAYPINPGIPSLFPWLSTMANSYELYKFRQLRFEYITRCPATTAGSIYLAIDWDANDILPMDKATMLAYQGAVSDAAWHNVVMNTPGQNLGLAMRERYTRAGEYPDVDQKTYDVGQLIIGVEASDDLPKSIHIGELWVSYEVELLVPQVRQANRAASYSAAYPDGITLNAGDAIFQRSDANIVQTGAVPAKMSADGKRFTFLRPWEGVLRYSIQKTGAAVKRLGFASYIVDALLDFGDQVVSSILTAPTTGATDIFDVVEKYIKMGAGSYIDIAVDAETAIEAAAIVFMTGPYSPTVFPGMTVSEDSAYALECAKEESGLCPSPPLAHQGSDLPKDPLRPPLSVGRRPRRQ